MTAVKSVTSASCSRREGVAPAARVAGGTSRRAPAGPGCAAVALPRASLRRLESMPACSSTSGRAPRRFRWRSTSRLTGTLRRGFASGSEPEDAGARQGRDERRGQDHPAPSTRPLLRPDAFEPLQAPEPPHAARSSRIRSRPRPVLSPTNSPPSPRCGRAASEAMRNWICTRRIRCRGNPTMTKPCPSLVFS
jgi:hypothetical protein